MSSLKLAQLLARRTFINSVQQIQNGSMAYRTSSVFYCTSKDVTAAPPTPSVDKSDAQKMKHGLTDHKVNKFEKLILVWGGKYKTTADVPDFVSQTTLERARNKARIKINLGMAAATALTCLVMIYLGKKALKEGDSVQKMNEEFHKEYRETIKKEQAQAS